MVEVQFLALETSQIHSDFIYMSGHWLPYTLGTCLVCYICKLQNTVSINQLMTFNQ